MVRRKSTLLSAVLLATVAAGPAATQPDESRRAKAVELLAKADALAKPTYMSGGTFCDIIDARIRLGRLDEARVIAEKIPHDDGYRLRALALVTTAQIAAGDEAGARHTVDLASDKSEDSDYVGLLLALGEFDKARELIDTLTYGKPRELARLAAAEHKAGAAAATADFTKAADLTAAEKNRDYWTVGDVALIQDECGDRDGAMTNLEKDVDPDKLRVSVRIATRHYGPADQAKLTAMVTELEKRLVDHPVKGTNDDAGGAIQEANKDWLAVIDGRVAVGDKQGAKRAIDGLIATAESTKELSLLADAAAELSKIGDTPGSNQLIDRAVKEAEKLKSLDAARALWAVANQMARSERFTDAPAIAKLAAKRHAGKGQLPGFVVGWWMGGVTKTLASHAGPAADFRWIDDLETDDAKAAAFAAAAAGMSGGS